jgi:hypothetical protein
VARQVREHLPASGTGPANASASISGCSRFQPGDFVSKSKRIGVDIGIEALTAFYPGQGTPA